MTDAEYVHSTMVNAYPGIYLPFSIKISDSVNRVPSSLVTESSTDVFEEVTQEIPLAIREALDVVEKLKKKETYNEKTPIDSNPGLQDQARRAKTVMVLSFKHSCHCCLACSHISLC
jgi:hypothetical protein